MTYSERYRHHAFCVGDDGSYKALEHVPFDSENYNEDWLQRLIADHPEILPTFDINGTSNLVLLGREVCVGDSDRGFAGRIDNLYATPEGKIVIVETKLHRNGESRHSVLSQIISYAKELKSWTTDTLDKIVGDYTYKKDGQAKTVFKLMIESGYLSSGDEDMFYDRLSTCLSDASFLLLIVGDGIRSNISQLVDFFSEFSHQSFDLGIVQLELYKFGSDTVVIPNTMFKTVVVEKTIFKEPEPTKSPKKPVIRDFQTFVSDYSKATGLSEGAINTFIDSMIRAGLKGYMSPTEYNLKLPIGDKDGTFITMYQKEHKAELYICPGIQYKYFDNLGIFPVEVMDDFNNFYSNYVDTSRRSLPIDKTAVRMYFSNIERIIKDANIVEDEVRKLVSSVSEKLETVAKDNA